MHDNHPPMKIEPAPVYFPEPLGRPWLSLPGGIAPRSRSRRRPASR